MDAPLGPPRPGMKASEIRNLVFMIAAAAVLLSVLVTLVKTSAAPRPRQAPPELAPAAPAGPEPGAPIEAGRNQAPGLAVVPDPGDDEEEPPQAKVPFKEDPNWAQDVMDGTEDLEDRGFFHLLHKASAVTEEELARTVELTLDSLQAFKKSAALRGRPVRVQGTLLGLRPREFPENEHGIRTAYEGQMVDIHWRVTTFFVLDQPDEFELWDVVEVRGYYFKIWKYPNKQNTMVECPLVVGKTFRKIPKYIKQKPLRIPGTTVDLVIGGWQVKMWEVLVIALAVVLIPFAALLIRRERRKYRDFAQDQTEKRKARFKASLQAAEKGPAGGAPAPPGPGAAPASAAVAAGPPGTPPLAPLPPFPGPDGPVAAPPGGPAAPAPEAKAPSPPPAPPDGPGPRPESGPGNA